MSGWVNVLPEDDVIRAGFTDIVARLLSDDRPKGHLSGRFAGGLGYAPSRTGYSSASTFKEVGTDEQVGLTQSALSVHVPRRNDVTQTLQAQRLVQYSVAPSGSLANGTVYSVTSSTGRRDRPGYRH